MNDRPINSYPTCYGHSCRTVSYPQAARKPAVESEFDLKCRGMDVQSSFLLPQYQAAQIGGAPNFVQEWLAGQAGRPLCTISSVQADQHKQYPWVNHNEPLTPEGGEVIEKVRSES